MYFVELILVILSTIILLIMVLVGVAFLTLMERKVLGYMQIRKGPNKLGISGILQPFSDAIKLFSKEQTFPLTSNYFLYYLCPMINLSLSLFCWLVLPYLSGLYYFNLGMLFLLCVMSLSVYTIMIAGWSSNSNYSLLGGIRAIAQTISYEVSMALVLISFMFLVESYSFFEMMFYQKYIYFMFITFSLMMVWMVIILAETNRTPFDFAEGESELVSGFNVEYSSGGFALLFLAEYSSILFMSMIFSVLFLGGDMLNFFFFIKMVFLSFFFIWVRGTLPRYRYDKLMNLAWKIFLSLSLNFLIFYLGLKIVLFSLFI